MLVKVIYRVWSDKAGFGRQYTDHNSRREADTLRDHLELNGYITWVQII